MLRPAKRRPEVHQGEVELARAPARDELVRDALGFWAGKRPSRDRAREHTPDVGIEHADGLLECKGQHGSSRIGTDAGKCQEGLEIIRYDATVALHDRDRAVAKR